jgi:hypothetical protein
VSITLKGMIHGQEVMVTLRGIDFARVKAQVEDASYWLEAHGGQAAEGHSPVSHPRRVAQAAAQRQPLLVVSQNSPWLVQR